MSRKPLLLAVVAFVSTAGYVAAQSVARPPKPQNLNADWTTGGWVTMGKGLTVGDGGVTTPMLRTNDVQTADVHATNVYADGGTFTRTLDVSGSASFRQRPSGVFLAGTLTRAASLTVGVGCSSSGGVLTVPGALLGDACDLASVPAAALNLGLTYDCFVTAANTVTIRSCGLVALVAAPAGEYRVLVSGPAP